MSPHLQIYFSDIFRGVFQIESDYVHQSEARNMWNCLKTGEIPKLAFFSKPLTNEINTEKNKEVKFTVLDAAVIQILRRRQLQTEVCGP